MERGLVHGIDIVPVVAVGEIAAWAVIAFGHAAAGIAVVQAESMADFLALHALHVGAGIIVIRIVLGMGMFDATPAPFMPPIEFILFNRGQTGPSRFP